MRKSYLILIIIISLRQEVKAQAYDINTFFNRIQYGFYSGDSNNYLQNQSTTQALLEEHLDSVFKLPTGSFYNALDKITFSGNRTFLSGLHNQVPAYDTLFKECKIDFTYGGIQSSTYSFFLNGTLDTNTAFLVMPGSGTFQSFYIASGATGNYHNQNCILRNFLKPLGDVYVYVRANEEFRGIWKNYYNTNVYNRLSYDVLDPYTKFHGRDWQDNLFSEINVWLHFLKKKYKRVVVMGLSAGGWAPLFSSLQIKPDACIVAAGFSAVTYQNFPVSNNENTILDGILGIYTLDSLRSGINNANTEFLFTYGNNETGVNLYEYNTHSLQDSFQTPIDLPNVNFSYFAGPHTFHCPSIDTFLERVLNKPKAVVTLQDQVCISDSLKVKLKFVGQGPYSFILYRNATLYGAYICATDSMTLLLTQAGDYQIRYLEDAGQEEGYNSDIFTYIKDSAINYNVVSNYYNCDSDSRSFNIELEGNSPWVLNYTLNSLNKKDTIYTPAYHYDFPDGNLNIQLVSNLNNCSMNINQNYLFLDSPISVNPLLPVYSCDSNKTLIHFSLEGKSPWKLNYLLNNMPAYKMIYSKEVDLYFENGLYYFTDIIDFNNCTVQLNQNFNFSYAHINAMMSSSVYQCDTNLTLIHVDLQGNPPWVINYYKNGLPQNMTTSNSSSDYFFENGYYNFLNVMDVTGCISILNQQYDFNFDTLEFQHSVPQYDCNVNKTKMEFDFQGNPPFTIQYTKNSIPLEIISNSNHTVQYFENGVYQFISVKDSTDCVQLMNEAYNFNGYPIQVTMTNPAYICDSNHMEVSFHLEGNSPFVIHYLKGGIPNTIITKSSDTVNYFKNGIYDFQYMSDSTACVDSINSLYAFENDTIECVMNTPVYNCDSNKTIVPFILEGNPPFTIHYFENLLSKQIITSSNFYQAYFLDGNYFFQKVTDATGCQNDINQIYSFNYQPLSGSITQQIYNCDSNKFQIDFLFTGNPPWNLEYNNGVTSFVKVTWSPTVSLYLPNGNWFIQKVTNNAGCIHYFNTPLFFSFSAITAGITGQIYDCDSNKLKVQFAMTGNPPWNIHYVKNGIVPVYYSYATNDPNCVMYLPNGSFTFLNVIDYTGCSIAPLFQTATNNYQVLTASKIYQAVDCDSAKIRTDYKFTGDAPWILHYKELTSGSDYFVTSYDTIISLVLNNGTYHVISVEDSKCAVNIDDTLFIDYTPLSTTITPIEIVCDSNQFMIRLISDGGSKPYTYEYYRNAVLKTLVSLQDTTNLLVPNGNYLFAKMSDAIGCEIQLNHHFDAQYDDFHFNRITTDYLCEKDSTAIHFEIDHQRPIWLSYRLNSSIMDTMKFDTLHTFQFKNGHYEFISLFDSLGCTDDVNVDLTINNEPISYEPITIDIDCNSREYDYNLKLNGKSPWVLFYNYNNIYDTLIIANDSLRWNTSSGNYYFVKIIDANQCEMFMGRHDSLIEFYPNNPLLQLVENKLVTNTGAIQYFWYYNNLLIDSVSGNRFPTQGDGRYYVTLLDKTGCLYTSNEIDILYPETINAYPNPSSTTTTILVNEVYGSYWEYTILDAMGNKLEEGLEKSPFKELDMSGWANGIYTVSILYEIDRSKHIIRLLRQ